MRTAKTRVDIPICFFLYSFIVLVSLFVWFKFEALKDTPKKINLWFWKKSFGCSQEAGVGLRQWQQLWVLLHVPRAAVTSSAMAGTGQPHGEGLCPLGWHHSCPQHQHMADSSPSLPAPTLLLPWGTTKLFFCSSENFLLVFFPLREINK